MSSAKRNSAAKIDPEAWHAWNRRLGKVLLRPRIFALNFNPAASVRGKTKEGVYFMVEAADVTIYNKPGWLMFGFSHLAEDDSLCRAVALRRDLQSAFRGTINVDLKATHYVIPRRLPMLQEPWKHLGADELRDALAGTPFATVDPGGWESLPEDRIERMLRSLTNQRTTQ